MENQERHLSLENVISASLKIPGVKVNRNKFLYDQFSNEPQEVLQQILDCGPVNAQCDRKLLRSMANRLINEKTLSSTGASFVAGLPGGLAMAATIPADILQFYAVAIRLAQELAYLYGEMDLATGEFLDDEQVTNRLILYCGVMLGVSGATQAVRIISSAAAKQALKKLPQIALTKTFYYPVVKSISKFFSISMTKGLFAKGISKAVPVIGGVVSGGITFATMRPMGRRLADALEEAHYSYSKTALDEDIQAIIEISQSEESDGNTSDKSTASTSDIMNDIRKAQQLLDDGIITEHEFAELKARLIARL